MTSAPVELSASPGPGTGTPAGSGADATTGVEALVFAALVQQALPATGGMGPVPNQIDLDPESEGQEAVPERHEETTALSGVQALLAALIATSTAPALSVQDQPSAPADPAPDAQVPTPATSAPTSAPAALPAAQLPPSTTPDATTARPPPATTPDATTTAAPAPDPGSVQVVASGPMTVNGPAATRVGDPTLGRSVAAQVIPEITRLVSDGEGVHRVTLQLNPKALGEVRVVLTMRAGEVHVRIAGGDEARNALASSSADLSRALHRIGIEEHRITLTDLPGQGLTTRGSSSDHPGDTRQPAHHPGGFDTDPHGQHSQHSWMGDETTATDGSSTSNPTDRTHVSARIQQANRTRAAGVVDLRM